MDRVLFLKTFKVFLLISKLNRQESSSATFVHHRGMESVIGEFKVKEMWNNREVLASNAFFMYFRMEAQLSVLLWMPNEETWHCLFMEA